MQWPRLSTCCFSCVLTRCLRRTDETVRILHFGGSLRIPSWVGLRMCGGLIACLRGVTVIPPYILMQDNSWGDSKSSLWLRILIRLCTGNLRALLVTAVQLLLISAFLPLLFSKISNGTLLVLLPYAQAFLTFTLTSVMHTHSHTSDLSWPWVAVFAFPLAALLLPLILLTRNNFIRRIGPCGRVLCTSVFFFNCALNPCCKLTSAYLGFFALLTPYIAQLILASVLLNRDIPAWIIGSPFWGGVPLSLLITSMLRKMRRKIPRMLAY